ncbi:uncharacterized protein LOC134839220 isoform X3 [Symsagittifera roscoffensis]|uniref:uncharacterized protein LOC134839220 isoform X3 n=1 Tax=Symsagittifera roscoffensis TaxID=84072 RepID=UPI00307B6766
MSSFKKLIVLIRLIIFLHIANSTFIPEPFDILKFGPENSDSFLNKKADTCSLARNISRSVKFGADRYTTLYVCMNGIVAFGEPVTSFKPDEFDNFTTPVLAPFFGDIAVSDSFLDEMCFDSASSYYVDFVYNVETICYQYAYRPQPDPYVGIQFYTDYMLDLDLKAKIYDHFASRSTWSGLTVDFDDYITRLTFGKDTTKYPNLGNNIMYREMTVTDLGSVDSFIRNTPIKEVRINWGFVATWFKVSPFPSRLDSFNTFQASLFCTAADQNSVVADGNGRCFALFDFFEVQWTTTRWQENRNARSGLNDGNGFKVELPFSGTPEMRNLWALSNINMPGMWLFEIGQSEDVPSISDVGSFSDLDSDSLVNCPDPILPATARMYETTTFIISNCVLPAHDQLEARFTGTDEDLSSILRYGPPTRVPDDGRLVMNYTIEANEEGVRFILISICHFSYSHPIKVESPMALTAEMCHEWDESESRKDYSSCVEDLSRKFGCPMHRDDVATWLTWRSDVWWARQEVENGLNGWEYDICCSDDTAQREELNMIGFCDDTMCEFNEGASLCIRSPRLACTEQNEQKLIYVSNQCCYSRNGALIREDDLVGAGRLNLEVNSMSNMPSHYSKDLRPLETCKKLPPPEGYPITRKHRPAIPGMYRPNRAVLLRGDPHLVTIDGIPYAFMGVGVYTMLETSLQNSTVVQASMRRLGDGSVFSGLAVSFEDNSLECYINSRGEFSYALNGNKMTLDGPRELILFGFIIRRNENNTFFSFTLQENNLIIEILVTGKFINFVVSPPAEFKMNMDGLLGHFDAETSNDFTTPDRNILPANSTPSVIHEQFGEAWKANKSAWIFSVYEYYVQIENDTEHGKGLVPQYEANFPTEAERIEAETICKKDAACILDVFLTGPEIAQVYSELEQKAANVSFWNEVAVAVEQRENVIAALTTDAQPQTEGATQASTEKAELRTASISLASLSAETPATTEPQKLTTTTSTLATLSTEIPTTTEPQKLMTTTSRPVVSIRETETAEQSNVQLQTVLMVFSAAVASAIVLATLATLAWLLKFRVSARITPSC